MLAEVVIVIVGFRNTGDVVDCLSALAAAPADPSFEVFVSENGGSESMNRLVGALTESDTFMAIEDEDQWQRRSPSMARTKTFEFRLANENVRRRVHLAEMSQNLGYAGGINAWLRMVLAVAGWKGVWLLNPDTIPTASALAELTRYSERRNLGMVGSRLVPRADSPWVHSCGLAWRRFPARTLAVGYHIQTDPEPDADHIETCLHAPSGASCYVTRSLIEKIGLMNERYFLFFEDLDWGLRARRLTQIGYAHHSVVLHKGGTTIGSPGGNSRPSRLGYFLEYRNRILFVRENYPGWLGWTVFMQLIHLMLIFVSEGKYGMREGWRGVLSGLRGHDGRPDEFFTPSQESGGHAETAR